MALISVEEALDRLLEDVSPLPSENVPLDQARGRYLSEPVASLRTQPPFPASAMDGYAVRAHDIANPPVQLTVIGEAPAGHEFAGSVAPGQTVRIFTGAPVPDGADSILIQENTERTGDRVTALSGVEPGLYVRPAGLDFSHGDILLKRGQQLNFRDLSLAAAMNHPALPVLKKPKVGILATGDELVPPGVEPGPDQIVASNHFGVAAYVEQIGGEAIYLGIAKDTPADIGEKVAGAVADNVDVLVTLGGASVGDHDLVQSVLGDQGMDLKFWRIAMRPGKPLMFGHLGRTRVLGLPGNPVSSLVCSLLFLRPLLLRLLDQDIDQRVETAITSAHLPANDKRQDYLRAELGIGANGELTVNSFPKQDSSMLALMSAATCLIVRPPFADAVPAGEKVPFIRL
ncbi:MAG: gephyrin-like molybdotransferase Glp [Stappiaceae bacterium]